MNKNNLSKLNVDCEQWDNRRNILAKMLLTPIVVDKLTTSIKKEGDTWISPQIYSGAGDSDMSDLSVAFYEIIYKDMLLDNKLLGRYEAKKGKTYMYINKIANSSFAGDTMNSFNTIAGKTIKKLSVDGKLSVEHYYMPDDPEGRLRLILDSDAKESTKKLFHKFYNLYHSLANFWIIPMKMGRGSRKKIFTDNTSLDPQDYMEGFLRGIEDNWNDLKKQECYGCYFNKFKGYDNFRKEHFICKKDYPEGLKDKTGIKDSLNEDDAFAIVSGMISAIENRAKLLSESKYAEQLWSLLNNIWLYNF